MESQFLPIRFSSREFEPDMVLPTITVLAERLQPRIVVMSMRKVQCRPGYRCCSWRALMSDRNATGQQGKSGKSKLLPESGKYQTLRGEVEVEQRILSHDD